MGTRNLTMVVLNGELKVSQYCQWDGYPSGQGVTAYYFLKGCALELFKEKVAALREGETDHESDVGAGILELIYRGQASSVMVNKTFMMDSLFCEWAYLIDLDKDELEVFEGFQKEKHSEGRFASEEPNSEGYYPVKLIWKCPISELPETREEFVEAVFEASSEGEDD